MKYTARQMSPFAAEMQYASTGGENNYWGRCEQHSTSRSIVTVKDKRFTEGGDGTGTNRRLALVEHGRSNVIIAKTLIVCNDLNCGATYDS